MHSLCFTWYSFIHWCGGKKEQFVWKRKRFFPPSLLSTVYQCDGCLSSRGCGGSWLVCQVLPAIGAVSVVVLAAKSGSSRMAQTPNAHLMTQLLIYTLTIIHININLIQIGFPIHFEMLPSSTIARILLTFASSVVDS